MSHVINADPLIGVRMECACCGMGITGLGTSLADAAQHATAQAARFGFRSAVGRLACGRCADRLEVGQCLATWIVAQCVFGAGLTPGLVTAQRELGRVMQKPVVS